jgi:hypothetical protein
MSWDKLEQLSDDDNVMMLAFGTLDPSIGRFPHCLFRASEDTLKTVLEVVGAKGGLWGDEPRVTLAGEPYLPPEDGRIIEDFVLWELPQNQGYVLSNGGYAKLGAFLMVIDVRTPEDVLTKIYSSKGSEEDDSHYGHYEYIERVSDWLEDLKWTYIPLTEELEFALFAAAPAHEGWVQEVENRLRMCKKTVFRLKPGVDRFHWGGPFYLQE